jgi:hypothetical protein
MDTTEGTTKYTFSFPTVCRRENDQIIRRKKLLIRNTTGFLFEPVPAPLKSSKFVVPVLAVVRCKLQQSRDFINFPVPLMFLDQPLLTTTKYFPRISLQPSLLRPSMLSYDED